jgi:hypothetical protein
MDLHMLLNPEESASLSRSAKKRKLRNGETMTVVRPTCHLARLPLELLADVLSYMRTPKEVLALSRCSKYFCATLVGNPAASFIWRDARQRCVPTAIPEPTQNFTESSYAAFIFDGGKCDVRTCFSGEFPCPQVQRRHVESTANSCTIHLLYVLASADL